MRDVLYFFTSLFSAIFMAGLVVCAVLCTIVGGSVLLNLKSGSTKWWGIPILGVGIGAFFLFKYMEKKTKNRHPVENEGLDF